MIGETIAIDIDDVLANSTESLRLLVNERTGAQLTREHYKAEGVYWGYYENVWRTHGLEGKVNFQTLNNEMAHDQSHVQVIPGALAAVEELARRYRIVLVTARDPSWRHTTEQWLESNFSSLLGDVHFAGHNSNGIRKTKGELCQKIGASYLIDDNVEHCQTASELGVNTILFGDYGWHQGVPAGQVACKDWPAVLEFFDVHVRA